MNQISKDGDGYDAEVKHGIANVRFARGLLSRSDCTMGNYVKYLTDEQLTDIVVMSKLDGTDFYGPNDSHAHVFRQAVVKSVPIEKVIPWLGSMLSLKAGAKSQDERERYRGTCDDIEFRLQKEMPEDQAALLGVIKRTAGYGLKEKTLNAMFREIRSSEAAEAFLANDYITPADIFCDKKSVFPLMASAMLLVGEPEKKRVVEEAKKHFQEHKGEVCIGPFYLDMPYYEGTLVAEAEKLYSKKGDLVTLYYDNEDPKAIMKDWKKNLRVKKIAFTMKGALKYLDCEDALVLQQAIKQCVKKEAGKAKSFDYLGEIKHDIKIDSSTRINLFSPAGTSTDYESEIWTSYSNTRMGVKLLHGKKSGMLILEAL